ncbi:MAG TPA: hypothetical protein VFQ45_15605 [Longimicrobium sp.]|nr:hypothetical protein [Longimicrobium sp.]
MSTHDHENDELPPELRGALAALPRERDPGRLLEERTIRALRERGLLEAPAARGRTRRFPAAWMGGAVAAAIALFVSGLAVGQWMAARNTVQMLTAIRAEDARQAAAQVQQTGSAYVAALSRFAEMADDSAATPQTVQGREVAMRMLRQAADEVVRIAPDDPVASGILAGFQRADSTAGGGADRRKTVWF